MSVNRTITASYDGVTTPIGGSAGKDGQSLDFEILLTNPINAGDTKIVYQWSGANNIQELGAICIRIPSGGMYPFALSENNATWTRVVFPINQVAGQATTGKKGISIGVPVGGTPIPANSTIYITVKVGSDN